MSTMRAAFLAFRARARGVGGFHGMRVAIDAALRTADSGSASYAASALLSDVEAVK
jgi:Na+/H+-translocating membrane pyrophosphatase